MTFFESHPLPVIPKRFERLTHALEGRCSIQLSYGTDLVVLKEKTGASPFSTAKIVRFFGYAKKILFFISVIEKNSSI